MPTTTVGDEISTGEETRTERAVIDELLLRTAALDAVAYDDLYRLFVRRVEGLCRRIVVDAADAEDVAQEVLLEVWTKAATFDPARGSGTNWMLGIARRRCIDRIRTSEASRRRDQTYHRQHGVPEPADTVTAHLIATSDAAEMAEAMGTLSELRREALAFAYYSDHTHEEASVLLGVPLGTFKSRVRDAVIALRLTLAATVR